MPKSKRNKQVELAKTKKHGLEGKKHLYNEIRSSIDTYTHLFIFSVNDMRNAKMKSVREQWKHSRFFIGKNKVMALALGRSPEEEYRPNLHKVGERLKGERGILFSNQPVDEVVDWFSSYSDKDFARSGNIATENVALSEGPQPQFPHSLESYLRQLGLPTTLQKGVVHLVKDHVICNQGDALTPETARILKLLGYEMAEFQVNIECVWSQDGSFQDLKSGSYDASGKENAAKVLSPTKRLGEIPKEEISAGGGEAMEVFENEDKEEQFIENFLKQDEPDIDEVPEQSAEEQTENNMLQRESVSEEEVGVIPVPEREPVIDEEENVSDPTVERVPDMISILQLTEEKITNNGTPPKYSPKMTRSRVQATSVKKSKVSKERQTPKAVVAAFTEAQSPEEIALRTRAARKVQQKKT